MYWVYENWTHKKAIVHKADCSFCNQGRGIHGGSSERNGRWLREEFQNREDAFRAAKQTGQQNVNGCGHCKP